MVDVTIPAGYGLVVLCNAVIPTLVMFFVLGSRVMGGRKKFGVPYPNMYATPGKQQHTLPPPLMDYHPPLDLTLPLCVLSG